MTEGQRLAKIKQTSLRSLGDVEILKSVDRSIRKGSFPELLSQAGFEATVAGWWALQAALALLMFLVLSLLIGIFPGAVIITAQIFYMHIVYLRSRADAVRFEMLDYLPKLIDSIIAEMQSGTGAEQAIRKMLDFLPSNSRVYRIWKTVFCGKDRVGFSRRLSGLSLFVRGEEIKWFIMTMQIFVLTGKNELSALESLGRRMRQKKDDVNKITRELRVVNQIFNLAIFICIFAAAFICLRYANMEGTSINLMYFGRLSVRHLLELVLVSQVCVFVIFKSLIVGRL